MARGKGLSHTWWSDDEVIAWAEEYINTECPLDELEENIGVPHSTLWWNFTHRLERLDPDLADLVQLTFEANKKKRGRKYA